MDKRLITILFPVFTVLTLPEYNPNSQIPQSTSSQTGTPSILSEYNPNSQIHSSILPIPSQFIKSLTLPKYNLNSQIHSSIPPILSQFIMPLTLPKYNQNPPPLPNNNQEIYKSYECSEPLPQTTHPTFGTELYKKAKKCDTNTKRIYNDENEKFSYTDNNGIEYTLNFRPNSISIDIKNTTNPEMFGHLDINSKQDLKDRNPPNIPQAPNNTNSPTCRTIFTNNYYEQYVYNSEGINSPNEIKQAQNICHIILNQIRDYYNSLKRYP